MFLIDFGGRRAHLLPKLISHIIFRLAACHLFLWSETDPIRGQPSSIPSAALSLRTLVRPPVSVGGMGADLCNRSFWITAAATHMETHYLYRGTRAEMMVG